MASSAVNRILRPAGRHALLIDFPHLPPAAELRELARQARRLGNVVAAIVGHQSVLVIFDEPASANGEVLLQNLTADAREASLVREHRIDVSFGESCGEDLERFLQLKELSREAFLRRLGGLTLEARFLGFAPGFVYLDGWPADWALDRLPHPRTNVPAGSFAIAGTMAAFYPSELPGGWNLLGRSEATFWDQNRTPPNLIVPGDRLVIAPDERPCIGDEGRSRLRPDLSERHPDSCEPIATVEHGGQWSARVGPRRWTMLELGAPAGGPFDEEASQRANQAAGNSQDATVLECFLVGPRLRFHQETLVACYGATAALRLNGSTFNGSIVPVRRDDLLEIGPIRAGSRIVIAVRGGWHSHQQPLEPLPLRTGESLCAGTAAATPAIQTLRRDRQAEITVWAGPHEISSATRSALLDQSWLVAAALDRRGIRLTPERERHQAPANLPSLGVQFGTVQWHPDGTLTAMGPDHPVTGGYLQPMVVERSELWKLAQLRPGDSIRWIWRS
jgi:KipI family sensor histidine kinase inhibitor